MRLRAEEGERAQRQQGEARRRRQRRYRGALRLGSRYSSLWGRGQGAARARALGMMEGGNEPAVSGLIVSCVLAQEGMALLKLTQVVNKHAVVDYTQCRVWYRRCGVESPSTNQNRPFQTTRRPNRRQSDRAAIVE